METQRHEEKRDAVGSYVREECSRKKVNAYGVPHK